MLLWMLANPAGACTKNPGLTHTSVIDGRWSVVRGHSSYNTRIDENANCVYTCHEERKPDKHGPYDRRTSEKLDFKKILPVFVIVMIDLLGLTIIIR